MKDLGDLKYFLGIEVSRSKQEFFLSHQKYVLDLLAEIGNSVCQPVDTPIEVNHGLSILPDKIPTNKERYKRMVGKLIYLTHTRPDISYAVSVMSQFMHNPSEQHMCAVNHILAYLKSSPGKGILFTRHGHLDIVGYTDSHFAGSKLDRKSTSETKKNVKERRRGRWLGFREREIAADLSYNNFSISQGSQSQICDDEKVNLFSTTWARNNIGTDSCMSVVCPKREFLPDLPGPARFHASSQGNWAFSTTGIFMETNGSYTVNLHFAEIMFTDDQTFGSLGRRIFDIYLQGKQVQQDFNIAEEAGGVGKKVIKSFKDVDVTSNTLEIRLYWAGKGTMAIPNKSAYGPLISAISVESGGLDFVHSPPGSISVGAVFGIVVAAIIIIILVFDLKSLDLQTGLFTLRQIKAATNNFHISNKIGEGGFGPVYKGCLSNGTLIAVKQLSSKSKQGNREFLNEIGMISALQHPYLVKLHGCCVEGDQLLLIYEYLENNSLARALFGPEEHQIKLDWSTRQKICVGIARGLAYLHEESRLKVVHRDIKATNVLLDTDLVPKISDFGLAKLDDEDKTHISTKIAGTYGYMAPEYAMHGYLTDKADVYSFGVVAFEIVSGRSNTLYRSKEEALYLLDWAHMLKEKGDLMELVDRRLGSDFNKKEAMVMIDVAFLCTNVTSNLRPSMSSVVSMLEGTTVVPEFISDSSEVMNEKKLEVMRQYYNQMEENKTSKSQTQSQSLLSDGAWTATTSSSGADLYPVQSDSSYWEKRN
ncbi:putative LRR receptor-like protein kinase [Trifolium pratense]|uniref:non-specific serine/threonine protein kinase n=1 Tax=Trifolium pratense TaxID=57577 RepID=A0A2K3PJD5_TRIPR|nr:putative LRR receptor-like protein kinase [Trifolium pratense]